MVEYVNKKVQSMLNDTLQQRQDCTLSESDEVKDLKSKLQTELFEKKKLSLRVEYLEQ